MSAIRPRSRLGIVLAALSALALAARRAGRTPTAVARGPTSTRSATSSRTSTGSRASPTPTSSTRGACPSGRRRRRGWPTTGPTSRRSTRGGVASSIPVIVPLVVGITGGAPTGTVFNPTSGFQVNGAPAHFIFDSEAGTITAWNSGTHGADRRRPTPGADLQGPGDRHARAAPLLYAAELPRGQDRRLQRRLRAGRPRPAGFADPNLPAGFAPFNVQEIGGRLVVAYAQQDADAEDEVAGPGLGYVDVFDTERPPAAAADLAGRR